jgi:ribonuclease HI
LATAKRNRKKTGAGAISKPCKESSLSQQQPDVMIYTDGACSGNPGPGGWAAILKHPASGKTTRLSGGHPSTTNNKMELTAPIEALKALKDMKRWRVHIVSDSEYLVRGMTEWMDGWIANNWRRGKKPNSPPVKNVELWKELQELCGRHDVSFEHVRGHAGHPENEECDRMAVAAIEGVRSQA